MGRSKVIALCGALVLGVLGSASAALATAGENAQGGTQPQNWQGLNQPPYAGNAGSANASVASPKHEHHENARKAYGAVASPTIDPRDAYVKQGKAQQTWCDVNPDCNGWAQWAKGVHEGKTYK
jgi:hypothetical protein